MYVTLTIGLAYFVVNINIVILAPLLGFMGPELGLSVVEYALILSAFPLVALPSNIIFGSLADRMGRKTFLLMGSVGCAISFMLTMFCNDGVGIALLRASTGLFMPMIGASVFASIPDYFQPSQRAKVIGYVSAASSLAQLIAVPFGVFVAETLDWRASFAILSIITAVLSILVFLLPRPQYFVLVRQPIGTARSYVKGIRSLFDNGQIVGSLVGHMMFICAVFTFLSLYPTWILTREQETQISHITSTIFFAGGVGGVVGALFSGPISARLKSPIFLCALLSGMTVIPVVLSPIAGSDLIGQLSCYSAFSIFRSALVPSLISGAMAMVSSNQRGSMNGLLNAIFQCGAGFGGILSTLLYSIDNTFFLNAAVSSILLAIAALLFFRSTGPIQNK